MHEYSIVNSLLELCEKNAKEQQRTKAVEIKVKIGLLSGVEPTLLQSAFEIFKDGTIAQDAVLSLDISRPLIRCDQCGHDKESNGPIFECPDCGSESVHISGGDELHLMSLTLF